jgi:hypothetical protein
MATKATVRKVIREYIAFYFPDADLEKTYVNVEVAIKKGRCGSVVIIVKRLLNGDTVRMCPYCLAILNCGLGLHFRVMDRPLKVLWVCEGSTEERDPEWYKNRQFVEDMAKSTRVIKEFTAKWLSSPLVTGYIDWLTTAQQVSSTRVFVFSCCFLGHGSNIVCSVIISTVGCS